MTDLEAALRQKDREISRLKSEFDNRMPPPTTPHRGTGPEQYSFLDRTFSEGDAEMIIHEFEMLERRSGGVASPIMT